MTTKVTTAQEFVDALKASAGALDELKAKFKRLRDSICNAAIERNEEIADLAHSSGDELRNDIGQLLMRYAWCEASARRYTFDFDGAVDAHQHLLMKLADEFCGLWNAQIGEFKKAKAVADQVEARRQEHAIDSPEIRERVWAMTDGRCIYCDVELTRERNEAEPHRCFAVDHLVAKSNGGPDHISNYVPSCARCNSNKHARPVLEFLKRRNAQPDLKVIGGTEAAS